MKTRIEAAMARICCFTVAVAFLAGVASAGAGEAKTARGGASDLMQLKPIKTPADVAAIKPGDTVMMACPKCKTIYVTRIEKENKPGKTREVPTSVHTCPGCENKIALKGHGRTAKEEIVHVCKQCGSKDAFCCVMKGDRAPTKGMDPTAAR
jgi:hypothetical protein